MHPVRVHDTIPIYGAERLLLDIKTHLGAKHTGKGVIIRRTEDLDKDTEE